MPNESVSLDKLAIRYDKLNIGRIFDKLPQQIDRALNVPITNIPEGPFDKVVVSGMGGSIIPVDILKDALSDKIQRPIEVIRSYEIQKFAEQKVLYIVISYSGDTEEALSIFNGLCNSTRDIIVITAGGQLLNKAKEKKVCLINIPKEENNIHLNPRFALGYIITLLARTLYDVGHIDSPFDELSGIQQYLQENDFRQDGEMVSRWLTDKIPVVYVDDIHLNSIARVTKIKFNENSKIPAFFNSFPEINHNEMIGFSRPLAKFGILYLHDPSSDKRILDHYQIMKTLMISNGFDHMSFFQWTMKGKTRFEKVMGAGLFADWCSYYLALLYKVDPNPVELIEEFKKSLLS